MIKNLIILICLFIISYSYYTGNSVKTMIVQVNDQLDQYGIVLQSPVIKKDEIIVDKEV